LAAASEIIELARDVLSPNQFEEATKLASINWRNKQERNLVIHRLSELVKPPPKRPLYYAKHEIWRLPSDTRDCIRYLGDYIDLLMKEMAFEFWGKGRRSSLTTNAKRLESTPQFRGLSSKLQRYCSLLYTPGKHDFTLPTGRLHRFNAAEVVLTTFITMQLAVEIRSVSKYAEDAARGETLYSIGGEWGSPERVKYSGRLIHSNDPNFR